MIIALVDVAVLAALMVAGVVLVRGDAGELPWLAGASLALLVAASVETWVLLSHAGPA